MRFVFPTYEGIAYGRLSRRIESLLGAKEDAFSLFPSGEEGRGKRKAIGDGGRGGLGQAIKELRNRTPP